MAFNFGSYVGNGLWNKGDVKVNALNGEEKTAFVIESSIFTKNNGHVVGVDISTVNPEIFINRGSVGQVTNDISDVLPKFSALSDFKEYPIVPLVPGDVVNVPIGNMSAFTISNKGNGQYFDTLMYHDVTRMVTTNCASTTVVACLDTLMYHDKRAIKACYYGSRSTVGGNHSGDIMTQGWLLQHLTITGATTDVYALGVCGYRRTALSTFVKQNPSIVIVDTAKKVLYLVPCPLDVATIGNNTFAFLATAQCSEGKLTVSVLDKPLGLPNVDTGCTNVLVSREMAKAIKMHRSTPSNTEHVHVPKVCEQDDDTPLPEHNVFIQKGLDMRYDGPCFVIGAGLTYYKKYEVKDKDLVTFSPFGTLIGPSVICCLQQYQGFIELSEASFTFGVNDAKSVVIHINEDWLETVTGINTAKCNGCIIVHSDASGSVKDIMTNIKISGVTAIAGPLATVLVFIAGRYYWYRGIPNYGIDTLPEFGDDVTDKVNLEQGNDLPKIFFTDTQEVLFCGELVDVDEAKKAILQMSFEEIVDKMDVIKMIFTQLQTMFDNIRLTRMITEITAFLEQKIKEVMVTEAPKDTDLSPLELAKLMVRDKGKRRAHQRKLVPLLTYLSGLISTKNALSQAFSLKQVERTATTQGNVAAAIKMTGDERMELVGQYASSVFLGKVSNTVFKESIKAMNRGVSFPFAGLISCDEIGMIDMDTTEELRRLSETNVSHELYSKDSIAFNTIGIRVYLPFALNDKVVGCSDPGLIFWVEECLKEEWAIMRILMASTIANSKTGKSLSLQPHDNKVRLMIVNIIIDLMTQVSQTMEENPAFDEPRAQVMRGLFGQLLSTLASGASPLSMAWQLVMKNTNIQCPKNDLWVYLSIINLFKFTGWSDVNIKANVQKLLVKMVKNKVCGSAIRALQAQIGAQAKADQEELYISRTIELGFQRYFCDIIQKCIREDLSFTDENVRKWFTTLHDLYSEQKSKVINQKRTTTDFLRFCMATNPSERYIEHIKDQALCVFTKRSGCFAKNKQAFMETDDANLEAEISKVKSEFAASQDVPVQNMDAYKCKDLGRIKGDAEFRRIPWALVPGVNNDWSEQIYGTTKSVQSQTVVVEVKPTKILKDVAGNKEAVQVLNDAKLDLEAVIEMSGISFDEITLLMYYIDVVQCHETLYAMIEALLTHYQDEEQGSGEAMRLLNVAKELMNDVP